MTHKRPGRRGLDPFTRMDRWIAQGLLEESPSGCWLWSGATMGNGYGQIAMTDKVIGGDGSKMLHFALHRWTYELHRDHIPDGLDLDHLCRVRHCCNPWHLEPVTRSVNLKRAVGIGSQWSKRTHCSAGHEYTTDNTSRDKRGHRLCRACGRDRQRRYKVAPGEESGAA